MDAFSKLFGSLAKVRILRLFLLNKDKIFVLEEIARRTGIRPINIRRELNTLEKAGFLKQRVFFKKKKENNRKNKKIGVGKIKTRGWMIDGRFQHIAALENLLVDVSSVAREEVSEKISRAGKIKMVVLAGIFTRNKDSGVDVLIVGDKIKQSALDQAIRSIESDMGIELRYAVFETSAFKYRISMFDRLLRDIFDYEHEIILDKMGFFSSGPKKFDF